MLSNFRRGKYTQIISKNNMVNTGGNRCLHSAEDKINHQYKWQKA